MTQGAPGSGRQATAGTDTAPPRHAPGRPRRRPDISAQLCTGCGFDYDTDLPSAVDVVREASERFAAAFAGRDGLRRTGDGSLSPREHLWLTVDLLRYGTERLWTLTTDPDAGVMPWLPGDALAVRRFSPLSVRVGLWAVSVAGGDWVRAALAAPDHLSSWHVDLGWMDRLTMVRRDAHDVVHRAELVHALLAGT